MGALDTLDLDSAVVKLTRRTSRLVRNGYGELVIFMADPLLVLLSMEIGNSSSGAGIKGSGTNPIPIAAAAYDLMQQITEEVTENYWNTYQLHKGVGRSSLAGQLRAWAMAAHADADLLAIATRAITGYVTQIEALLSPVRRWDIRGKCPICGASKVEVLRDGEYAVSNALSVFYSRDGAEIAGAECLTCGHRWAPGTELETLARIVANQKEDGSNGKETTSADTQA